MSKISVELLATSTGAVKAMQDFEKAVDRSGRKIHDVFGRGIGQQGTKSLQTMSRAMQELTKRTDEARRQAEDLQRALVKVRSERESVISRLKAGGRDKDLLGEKKELTEQIRRLEGRARRVQDRQLLYETRRSRLEDEEPAPSKSNALGNVLKGGGAPAMAFIRGALGPLAALASVAGLGAFFHQAFQAAGNEQKNEADILPRLLGARGLGSASFYGAKIQRAGLPYGFSAEESHGAFRTMSAGGGTLGGPLEADTKTAMQMARLFGLDLGGQASTLASAQRTGAFKAGDAKRFAEMLAQQIAYTGLGPRVEEVQEATLMLLHSQLQTMPNANLGGGMMQLQTLFNRSGIAAFQGTQGAGMIANMQRRVNEPGTPAADALHQMVFRQMGIKDFFGMERAKERGLDDPKFLPTLFNTLQRHTPNRQFAQYLLKQDMGIGMLQSDALFKAFPHGIGSGQMSAARAILEGGRGKLDAGAKAAMDLPGNQLRQTEAAFHEFMINFGKPMVEAANNTVGKLAQIYTADKTSAEKLSMLTDFMMGRDIGSTPKADFSSPGGIARTGVRAVSGNAYVDAKTNKPKWQSLIGDLAYMMDPITGMARERMAEAGGAVGSLWHKGWANPSWKGEVRTLAQGLGLHPTSENRPGARTLTGKVSRHATGRAFDFKGSADQMGKLFDAIRTLYPGQIDELFYGPKGSIKNNRFYSPGTFNHAIEAQHSGKNAHVHVSLADTASSNALRIIIEEHGVVGDASKRALYDLLNKWADNRHTMDSRVHPNHRNRR